LYRSGDGGVTWVPGANLTGINPPKFLYQASSGTLFAGGWGIDSYLFIHRSTDNGETWDSITVVPETHCDWSIDGFYEADDGTLYVMGWNPAQVVGTGGGFIRKSADDGLTWDACAKIIRGDGVHNCRVYDMVEDLSGTIFAGMQPAYDSVVFSSSDKGESWNSTGGLAGAFECLCLLRASNGTIYAGTTPNGDVFRWNPLAVEETSFIPGIVSIEVRSGTEPVISYNVPFPGHCCITAFDISGRKVHTLIDEYRSAGSYTMKWETQDEPSGMYFIRFKLGNQHAGAKLILVR
jgi:hypothetical protein